MKRYKILIFLTLFLFASCGTVKEGFQNPKKNNSDEFLVEKKSPLVMPPDFNELPIPKNNKDEIKIRKNNIKDLINDNSVSEVENKKKNVDLEGSILEKIKTE